MDEIIEFYSYLNHIDNFFGELILNKDQCNIDLINQYFINYYSEFNRLKSLLYKGILNKINFEDFFNFYFRPYYDKIKIYTHCLVIKKIIIEYIKLNEEFTDIIITNEDDNEDIIIQNNLEEINNSLKIDNFVKFSINKFLYDKNNYNFKIIEEKDNGKIDSCLFLSISDYLSSKLKNIIFLIKIETCYSYNHETMSMILLNKVLNKLTELQLNEIFKDFIDKKELFEREKMFLNIVIKKIFDVCKIYRNDDSINFNSIIFNYFNKNNFKNEGIRNIIFEFLVKL